MRQVLHFQSRKKEERGRIFLPPFLLKMLVVLRSTRMYVNLRNKLCGRRR